MTDLISTLTAPRCLYGARLDVKAMWQAVLQQRRQCPKWADVPALSDIVPLQPYVTAESTLQLMYLSSFAGRGDSATERWWLYWIPELLVLREHREKLRLTDTDYMAWILDGMENYWWFTAALLMVQGSVFSFVPPLGKTENREFMLQTLEQYVHWLPEMEVVSPFFQAGGCTGESMRRVWPATLFHIAHWCGYPCPAQPRDLGSRTAQSLLEELGVITVEDGRPMLNRM